MLKHAKTAPHPTVAERLFNHALRMAGPCRSFEGIPCAIVPSGASAYHLFPVRSVQFRDWLAETFHTEHEVFPSHRALLHALQLFETKARRSAAPPASLTLRTCFRGNPDHPDALLLDLANSEGEAVEITPQGWRIVANDPIFRSTRTSQPLPKPLRPAPKLARSLLSSYPPAIVAWLLAALRPIGPYPILILQGPAASGKTTLARLLRALIDPATAAFCPHPSNERELLRLAWNNYVLAFDHVPHLRQPVARALCRLSTGVSFATDQSSADSISARLQRPILLTLPDQPDAGPCDALAQLANHAITVQLPSIASTARRSELDIFTEFEAARPHLLGALCSAVSLTLTPATATTTAASGSRFVDAYTWAVAACPALGISQDALRATLCPDPLTREIAAFAAQKQAWEGSATELLEHLRQSKVPNLPASPNHLARRLRHLPLSTLGVSTEFHKGTGGARAIRVAVTTQSTATKTQVA